MLKEFLNKKKTGWRDGSMLKKNGCSCKGPGFNFPAPTYWLTIVCSSTGDPQLNIEDLTYMQANSKTYKIKINRYFLKRQTTQTS